MPARRGVVRRALTGLGVLLALVTGGAPAQAHDGLVASEPTDGSVLAAAPEQVVLTFSADQLDVGSAVLVTGAEGTAWGDGEPLVAGATVTQPLLPSMPPGPYVVEWRSVSGDGHPVVGSFGFTVDAPPSPVATPDPATEQPLEPSSEVTVTEQALEPSPEVTVIAQAPAGEPAATGSTGAGRDAGAWAIAGLVVTLVAATIVAVAIRRSAERRRQQRDGER